MGDLRRGPGRTEHSTSERPAAALTGAGTLEEVGHGRGGGLATQGGQDVEGVLGQGQLRVGHRLASETARRRSTKVRADPTGTSVSLTPWRTKNGGASAWTR